MLKSQCKDLVIEDVPDPRMAVVDCVTKFELICLLTCIMVSARKNLEVVTLGQVTFSHAGSMHYLSPTFDAAAERFRARYNGTFYLKHTHLIDPNVTNCVELVAQSEFLLAEWYHRKRSKADIYVFLSPVCSEMEAVNHLLANWDILMISTQGTDPTILHNKLLSPTWITTSPIPRSPALQVFTTILTRFQWRNIYLVHDTSSGSGYALVLGFLLKALQAKSFEVVTASVSSRRSTDFSAELRLFQRVSRVLIFLGHGEPFRQLMIQASRLNMTNGEYVYVTYSHFKFRDLGVLSWEYDDQDDIVAREAFRSVLIVGPDQSIYALPDGTSMSDLNTGYVSALNRTYPVKELPLPFVSSVFTAFAILGRVLNESLTANPDMNLTSGTSLAKKFMSRTFDLTFTSVFFDHIGQRLIREELTDMNQTTGQFQAVFRLEYTDPQTLVEIGPIDWGGPPASSGIVPLNEPACGFLGDRGNCSLRGTVYQSTEFATLLATLALVLLATVGILLYNRRRVRTQQFSPWLTPADLCVLTRSSQLAVPADLIKPSSKIQKLSDCFQREMSVKLKHAQFTPK
ncbi:hypothetical protein RvY_13429 [Ramazzottius varieornatus]|uniref:Receptor ligand binding region domain-containing protein n=1 Tax=Ramazzottius varieornatus TaxID=947166 RepID=A0A1D1VQ04_RAMVA|nr:hypothetical protein RvY_13429 [Ramazzottius varieornatus]